MALKWQANTQLWYGGKIIKVVVLCLTLILTYWLVRAVMLVPDAAAPQRMAKEITGKDGALMVVIPEGEFWMGAPADKNDEWFSDEGPEGYKGKWDDLYGDERPAHRVWLDAFYLDQYEVTTSRYSAFMQASGRGVPKFWEQPRLTVRRDEIWEEASLAANREKPVAGVDWHDAYAYCEYYGKRLPTEAEWEKAARGTDGRKYPWGNEYPRTRHVDFDTHGSRSWMGYSSLTVVGSKEAGRSPYGVYDMAGNVWEWVADWYDADYYQQSPERNPQGPSSGKYHVFRGGSWLDRDTRFSATGLRSTNRNGISHGYNGFRCAQDTQIPQLIEAEKPQSSQPPLDPPSVVAEKLTDHDPGAIQEWEFMEEENCDGQDERCPSIPDMLEHKFIVAPIEHGQYWDLGFTCEHRKGKNGTEENIINFRYETFADRLFIHGQHVEFGMYDIEILVNGRTFVFPMEYRQASVLEITKRIDLKDIKDREFIKAVLDGEIISFDGSKWPLYEGSKKAIRRLFEICKK